MPLRCLDFGRWTQKGYTFPHMTAAQEKLCAVYPRDFVLLSKHCQAVLMGSAEDVHTSVHIPIHAFTDKQKGCASEDELRPAWLCRLGSTFWQSPEATDCTCQQADQSGNDATYTQISSTAISGTHLMLAHCSPRFHCVEGETNNGHAMPYEVSALAMQCTSCGHPSSFSRIFHMKCKAVDGFASHFPPATLCTHQ